MRATFFCTCRRSSAVAIGRWVFVAQGDFIHQSIQPSTETASVNPRPLDRCRVLELPVVKEERGNLTFIEGSAHIPFPIERVYYLYDVPGGSERGGHAHRNLQQLIIAMSGSFDVLLDDGYGKRRYHLNRSYNGLLICPMVWRELDNFSGGSVCLVLASAHYDEADYYRNYDEFSIDARRNFRP